MTRTFFTSAHHFGHVSILSPKMNAPRPFALVQEHDRTLIACWNAVVRPDDIVWLLGDFAYRATPEHARGVFHRLNGRKFLIRGNHEELGDSLPWDGPVKGRHARPRARPRHKGLGRLASVGRPARRASPTDGLRGARLPVLVAVGLDADRADRRCDGWG